MNNKDVYSNKQRLDVLFEHIKELRKLNNLQIEAQWALYLTIRVSGLLETSLRTIYTAYCDNKAHPNVLRFIGYSFEKNRSQNMNPETIFQMAHSFNEVWENELREFLSNNGRKEAIESVINLRNRAAHGVNVNVSFSVIQGYYPKVWEVIEFVEQQCQKTGVQQQV